MEYWRLDVSSEEQWAGLAAHLGRSGAVHGLVNNAGVPYRARLLDMDLAGWDRVMAINLTGAMLGMRTLAPLMPATTAPRSSTSARSPGSPPTTRSRTRSPSGACAACPRSPRSSSPRAASG